MMEFFWVEFKTSYWFGLLSKTSKIAPRHARLTVMYTGVSIQILTVNVAYMVGIQFHYLSWIMENLSTILA